MQAVLTLSLLIPAILSASRPACPAGAEETKPFVAGEIATIRSNVLGEDRQLFIYTHPAYGEDDSRYPVAYVLDGEWNFRYTSGVIDLLSSREAIPWMIVVGIPNVDRHKDLSPSATEAVRRGGGASDFRRFLRDEVFPFIESRYRTEPFRLLIGHSLSGLFTVDTFLADPDLFNAYVAVSPYLIWDDDRYWTEAVTKRARWPGRRTSLSVSRGAEPRLKEALERLEGLLSNRDTPGLKGRLRIFPEEDHETIFLPAVARGLLDIFPGWRLPPTAAAAGLDGIREHYEGLSSEYGYPIRPVYFVVLMIGAEFMDRGEVDEAIRILRYAAELNPGLPGAYEKLGTCFRRKGLIGEAVRSYEKALRLAPEDAEIRKILEELKKKGGRHEED